MTNQYSISDLPQTDRPRERLLRHGPESMSTSELIAIILGSGMKGIPILQLSHEIISKFGTVQALSEATISELCQIKGLGPAKALQLKAACSLGARIAKKDVVVKFQIENPIHAYNLVKDEMQNEKRELFVVILLDVKGCVICHQVVAVGTLSNTLVHPREVFYPAIRHNAASMILVHNHPSGDPTPSKQDYEVTTTLVDVSRVMGISINDHLIIGDQCYISLRQQKFSFS